jgi:hypothetical protein
MKNKIKIDCRVELKRIITFPKRVKKKNRNQNNDDQIEKHNTVNLD